jgi:flagellin-like protein
MNTKKMAKRAKDSAVSPVIATILMVAITVVLAAVLYVMVSGFTHSPGTANSAGLNEAQLNSGNWTVTISSVSASNIPLSNLRLIVNGTSWTYTETSFTAGNHVASVTLSILPGNSPTYLEAGDYFTIGASGPNANSWNAAALTGATVTLYNGNAQLGTVTL